MTERNDVCLQERSESTDTPEADTLSALLAGPVRPEMTHNGHDSRDTHLRQILTALEAFREGDFSVRLPTDWADVEGRIAESFNQTISQEDRISQEITRLSVM